MDTDKHGVAMAMPATFPIDAPPLSPYLSSPSHHAKQLALDLLRSPVQAVGRKDADTPRTERAHDAPGTPRTAWQRHQRTDARDPGTRRSPYSAVPRPPPLALVPVVPRGARRTSWRHHLAPTVAGEDTPACHGRGSTRARPTTVRPALPRRRRSEIRRNFMITAASSPSPLARRNRRAHVDPNPAPQLPLPSINRGLP
jgi:hypothetical protein